jgi:hypothetical protein
MVDCKQNALGLGLVVVKYFRIDGFAEHSTRELLHKIGGLSVHTITFT